MLEYLYLEDQTLDQVNFYANEGWRIEFINKIEIDKLDVMLVSGADPVAIQTEQIILDLTQEKVINYDTGAEFIVNQSVSYGDFLIIIFLFLFLVFGVAKFLIGFFVPKFINFKR